MSQFWASALPRSHDTQNNLQNGLLLKTIAIAGFLTKIACFLKGEKKTTSEKVFLISEKFFFVFELFFFVFRLFFFVFELFLLESEKNFLSLVVSKSISIQLFLPSRVFSLG